MIKTVSVSNLKAKLSAFLDIVRQGDEILVTDRGRLIARLGPIAGDHAGASRRDLLLRTGRLRPPRHDLPADFWDRARPADPDGRGLTALLAERESGW